ncbi:hypothetical protein SLEP1_g55693 [Rubroshorea leprosula]|uniref:SAP domain-containing protein n=1 Tax=Rubroshorea leprosula TaxID=152421 RepID=A0AAV5MJZ4_9ROSI|nr:hypothetical protein SLEP1_g55693 [Rubroshorea leprosula]
MGSKSKRLLSNSSVSASLTIEGKADKKLKGLATADLNSDEGEVKGNGGKGKVVMQGKNDNKDQGLVGTNRDSKVGVFKDIINDPGRINAMTVQQLKDALWIAGLPAKGCKSDLVSALKSYLDKQLEGESSHLGDEQLSSISAQSISVSGKTGTLSGELDAKIVRKGKKLSIKERKPSQAIRKASLVIDGKDANDRVNVPMSQSEPWTIFSHKKAQKGLRALLKLEGFPALEHAKRENFDALCLQETKLQEKDVESIKHSLLEGYENSFWTCSVSKLGYSGTAIISRIKPLSVKYGLGISDHDSEGCLVTAEFNTFYLLSAYVPNSGDGLRRLIGGANRTAESVDLLFADRPPISLPPIVRRSSPLSLHFFSFDRKATDRSITKLPPSIKRNCAASAPQWTAISRLVSCQTASSLENRAAGPGMRRWSLRSLRKTKMKTQQKRPIVEMLRRYWMLPYQAPSIPGSPSKAGEGGGEGVWFIGAGDLEIKVRVIGFWDLDS